MVATADGGEDRKWAREEPETNPVGVAKQEALFESEVAAAVEQTKGDCRATRDPSHWGVPFPKP